MHTLFKKLGTKGFAHHLLIPVIAVVAIAGIGTYVVTKSKACTNAASCESGSENYGAICGSGYTLSNKQVKGLGELRQYTKKVSKDTFQSCGILVATGAAKNSTKTMQISVGKKVISAKNTKKTYVGPVYGWDTFLKGALTYSNKTTNYQFVISGK